MKVGTKSVKESGPAAGWKIISEGRNKVGEDTGFRCGLAKAGIVAGLSHHQDRQGLR